MAVDLNPSSIEGYIDIECAIRQIWTFQNVQITKSRGYYFKTFTLLFFYFIYGITNGWLVPNVTLIPSELDVPVTGVPCISKLTARN